MVLSHSRLKRKRKEDLVAVLESGGPPIPQTSPSAIAAPNSIGEGKKKKTKKEMKNKKQKTNGSGDVDRHLTGSNGAVEDTEVQLWKEVQASKETRKNHKMEKKEEKKKRKAAEREAVTSQVPSSTLESDAHQVENRTDEAASNGVDKAEQPADENGAIAERPMSVREKKGKKKKGAKDRWGVTIADVDQVVENPVTSVEPVEPGAMQETPSTSTSTAEELYDLKKVFVGGMPYYATEDDIHEYFAECGLISELDCMTFPDTGNFRGIAFITFKTEEGAAKSLEYDGADMGGRFLKIEKCKLKPRAAAKDPERGEVQKTPGSTSAYIGNLSWDVTEDVIKNFFKKSFSNSKIDSIRLAFDKDTGDFKGFGHVDFGDDDSLEAAVKLNQTPLLGRPMKIAYSVPPKKSFTDGGNRNSNDSKSAGSCYNCGEEGHKAFLCPKKGTNSNGKSESGKVAACYSCGEEGHKSFLCPKKKAS